MVLTEATGDAQAVVRYGAEFGHFALNMFLLVGMLLFTRTHSFGMACYYFIGMTKLAGYSLCLSVIESTIPKSRNTALATIFPPIELGIPPTAVRPFEDLQSY